MQSTLRYFDIIALAGDCRVFYLSFFFGGISAAFLILS
jgi:hypothetical protein